MRIYLYFFLTGIVLSWGPCFSFCAPILAPYIAATQKNWLSGLKLSLAFCSARIGPYVILSLISAKIGQSLIAQFYQTRAGSIIYALAAGVVIILGLVVLSGKSDFLSCCLPVKNIKPAVGIGEMFLLGIVVGFAPCIPLLGVLTFVAFHARNLAQGAALGLVFGLGTLFSPLILLGPLAGALPRALTKRPQAYKIFSKVCGIILLLLGLEMLFKCLRQGGQ